MTFSSERDAILNQEAIQQRIENKDWENDERLDRLNRLATRLVQEAQEILNLQFGAFDPSLLNEIYDEAQAMHL